MISIFSFAFSLLKNNVTSLFGYGAYKFGSKVLRKFDSSFNSKLFGAETYSSTLHATLKNAQIDPLGFVHMPYGDNIPLVYGTSRVNGSVIWALPVQMTSMVEKISYGASGFMALIPGMLKSVKKYNYRYYATFAIAICQGEIDSVTRIWVDDEIIDFSSLKYRLYKGSETQMPDPIMKTGCAYRGIAYIVIENYFLNDFSSSGGRLPSFSFEVTRNLIDQNNAVEHKINAMNIIPGCGEFVYATNIIYKYNNSGAMNPINNNTEHQGIADAIVALDQMHKTLPNLEWISVVAVWFASSLNAGDCEIYPAVEYYDARPTSPDEWSVNGLERNEANLMMLGKNGRPLYGGTPSDKSIREYIIELKKRGYKVMLYPMIFVMQNDKPWRGHINAADKYDIDKFFEQYNKFILHYANIAFETNCDGFIIGSELKGITSFNIDGVYDGVLHLTKLAHDVRLILKDKPRLTYAADWSEYHSHNGNFNMDVLWSSPYISCVGIDAYFPLTNIKNYSDNPSIDEIINSFESGEGYDYYYDEYGSQISYKDPKWAWKNIRYWWSMDRELWKSKSKPIMFTEFGFSSLHGTTNSPNIFFDPDSSDGGLPKYSNGSIDFDLQRIAIDAFITKWKSETEMILGMFLWCYDARPYPYFPLSSSVWTDGKLWQMGHWVSGKLGRCLLSNVIKDLISLSSESIIVDTPLICDTIDGLIINSSSVLNWLQILCDTFYIEVIEQNASTIQFKKIGQSLIKPFKIESHYICDQKFAFKTSSIKKVFASYISGIIDDYEVRTISASNDLLYDKNGISDEEVRVEFPIIMNQLHAAWLASSIINISELEKFALSLKVGWRYAFLEISDLIFLDDYKKYVFYIVGIDYQNDGLLLTCRMHENSVYNIYLNSIFADDYFSDYLNLIDKIEQISNFQSLYFISQWKPDEPEVILKNVSDPSIWSDKSCIIGIHKRAQFGKNIIYNGVDVYSNDEFLYSSDKEVCIYNIISGSFDSGEIIIDPGLYLSSINNSDIALINKTIVRFNQYAIASDNNTIKITGFAILDHVKELFGDMINIENKFLLLDKSLNIIKLADKDISAREKVFEVKGVGNDVVKEIMVN